MPGTHVAIRTRTERAGDANEVKVLHGTGAGINLLLRHATQPEERLEEVDQTDPAGRYRSYVNGDVWYFQRAASASWATATTLWQADANGVTFSIPQTFTVNDATANDVTAVLTLNHNTTGTPATSLGTRLAFGIETSTTVSTTAGLIDVLWTTVTHATRTSDMVFSVVVSAVTTEFLRLDGSASEVVVGQVLSLGDDIAIKLGTGGIVSLIYETADANANALLFVAPEGGATDVPVFIFGDASILNVDLTWFNGVVEPTIVVVNDAADAYVSLDAGDDAVASAKGLYFKAAADEDIELLNLSVTGTPRFYWDESEDQFRFSKGVVFDALCDVQGVWVATAAWTLPAFTMGGDISGGAYDILALKNLGGNTAHEFKIFGRRQTVADSGDLAFYTTGVTPGFADTIRLQFTGSIDAARAIWSNITHDGLDITSGQVLKVAGIQVVAARVVDARCDDVINSGDATTDGVIDALRDAMITHGLIAAA